MNTALKGTRKKIGLTQIEVAKKANVSERTYQDYEAGNHIPRADTAINIANALNSTVEKLWGSSS